MFKVPKPNTKSYKFYEFSLDDGKTVHKMWHLRNAPVEAVEDFDAERVVTGFVRCCLSGEGKAAIRRLDDDQFNALLEDWRAASQTTLGESPASTDS